MVVTSREVVLLTRVVLALVVAGQLLAEGLARALGLNPDAPRGLNKVTQTDT